MKKKNIILGVTGSIAAYKSCELVNMLKKHGFEVTCILTAEAEKFITPLTLETLSGNRVYASMFALPDNRDVIHVSLAQKADIIVIAPATANIIAKLASGLCDDLLTSTVASSTCPVLIAPAMNDNMYRHRITQRNIQELLKIGYKFIEPIVGHLACGYVGMGHLADLGQIIKRIKKISK